MKPETMVIVGGVFSAGFAVFHLLFWKLFRWRTELAKLTSINRSIFQILNLCLTFVFVIFASLSLAYPSELVATDLGRALLLLIAVFWYLRAVEQAWFFGLQRLLSILLFVIFLVVGSLYAIPSL
jgi:hypothetical protein